MRVCGGKLFQKNEFIKVKKAFRMKNFFFFYTIEFYIKVNGDDLSQIFQSYICL